MYVILNEFNRNDGHIADGGAHIFTHTHTHTHTHTWAGHNFILLYNLMKYYDNVE
jgi:hypothetical protein